MEKKKLKYTMPCLKLFESFKRLGCADGTSASADASCDKGGTVGSSANPLCKTGNSAINTIGGGCSQGNKAVTQATDGSYACFVGVSAGSANKSGEEVCSGGFGTYSTNCAIGTSAS